MVDNEKKIQEYRNKLNKINKNIRNLKKPKDISFNNYFGLFLTFFILSILFFFIIWPIIVHICLSILYFLCVFAEGNTSLDDNFRIFDEIVEKNSWLASIAWDYWKVTLMILFIILISFIILKFRIDQVYNRNIETTKYYLTKLKIEYKEKLDKALKEFEKEQERKRKEFEAQQKAKGLVKFIDNLGNEKWGTPKQIKKWKEIEIGLNNNFANLTGYQFEELIAELFARMGYKTKVTPKSGDYGVDVIAMDKEDIIAIQCKKLKDGINVSNRDIQRARGSMDFYDANKCIIITNQDFTIQAKEQARRTKNTEIWNKHILHQMVRRYFIDA